MKNLEDKDLLFVKEECLDEDEDAEDEDDVCDEEEENEEENYEDEIRDVLLTGIEKENKTENILQEISSLKNSFFEYSLSESIYNFYFFSHQNLFFSNFQKLHR